MWKNNVYLLYDVKLIDIYKINRILVNKKKS